MFILTHTTRRGTIEILRGTLDQLNEWIKESIKEWEEMATKRSPAPNFYRVGERKVEARFADDNSLWWTWEISDAQAG